MDEKVRSMQILQKILYKIFMTSKTTPFSVYQQDQQQQPIMPFLSEKLAKEILAKIFSKTTDLYCVTIAVEIILNCFLTPSRPEGVTLRNKIFLDCTPVDHLLK